MIRTPLRASRQMGHGRETCLRIGADSAGVFRVGINDDRAVAFGLEFVDKAAQHGGADSLRQLVRFADRKIHAHRVRRQVP